ncbi:MAG: hypothetical protein LUC24_00640 [Bacteroidales bacterium]|nr:hypothetical protein [Bacteroidales bacterium]
MAGELAIIRPESIRTLTSDMPAAFEGNRTSRDRCVEFGQRLLDEIRAGGMTDELDQRAAKYIEKSRKTLAKMNEGRSAFTKIFDSIRSEFTALENDVDPSKKGTVAYEVQRERNAYAATKREEERHRQVAEQERVRKERAEAELRAGVERIIRQNMSAFVKRQCDTLQSAFNYATLENFDATVRAIREFLTDVPAEFAEGTAEEVRSRCSGVPDETLAAVLDETLDRLRPNFESYYAQEIGSLKAELLDRFPSKRAQLVKAEEASAEEAERIRRQMEEADRQAAEKREAERLEKEERDRQEAALAAKRAEAASLFDQAAAQQETYQPKTKVTKKIELLNPEGILPVISFWFSREGCKMTVEELAKTFKKQITFAEKIANCANPELIRDESVAYVDEVKAR